jgi:glycosyltransferase involved in cell wall biosynthesis
VFRCSGATFNKDRLPLRLLNAVTISLVVLGEAIRRFRCGDVVLVVTNPPLLPFVVWTAAWLHRARVILVIHDVYPEVLLCSGLNRSGSLVVRAVAAATRWLYRRMERVIVLGRDMAVLAAAKMPGREDRIDLIPNWADLELVVPAERHANALLGELGLRDKFVIQYAGNMGRTHGLEAVLAAAELLREEPRAHFVFLGSGAKRDWLVTEAHSRGLSNVTVLGPRPRSDQPNFLNACDVAIISFVHGMAGVSVPSRMYNILAAGKPIVAVADPQSELAQVVVQEGVGWLVAPENAVGMASAIRDAMADPVRLTAIAARARRVVEAHYSEATALGRYRTAVWRVLGCSR